MAEEAVITIEVQGLRELGQKAKRAADNVENSVDEAKGELLDLSGAIEEGFTEALEAIDEAVLGFFDKTIGRIQVFDKALRPVLEGLLEFKNLLIKPVADALSMAAKLIDLAVNNLARFADIIPVVGEAFRFLTQSVKALITTLTGFSATILTISSAIEGLLIAKLGGTAAALGAVGAAATTLATTMGSTLEDNFRQVSVVLVGTVENLRQFRELMVNISADVPESMSEVAAGMRQVVKAGVRGERRVEAVSNVLLKLGRVTNTTAAQISSDVLQISEAFNLLREEPVASINRLGDTLRTLSVNTRVSITEIVKSTARIAPMASLLDISADRAAALAATIQQAGQESSRGGTRIRRGMQEIVQTLTSIEDRANLAELIGIPMQRLTKLIREDFGQAFFLLIDRISESDNTAESLADTLNAIGEAGATAIAALASRSDLLSDLIGKLEDDTGTLNTANQEALNTLTNQLSILFNQITTMGEMLGFAILEPFKDLVKAANENLQDVVDRVQRFSQKVRSQMDRISQNVKEFFGFDEDTFSDGFEAFMNNLLSIQEAVNVVFDQIGKAFVDVFKILVLPTLVDLFDELWANVMQILIPEAKRISKELIEILVAAFLTIRDFLESEEILSGIGLSPEFIDGIQTIVDAIEAIGTASSKVKDSWSTIKEDIMAVGNFFKSMGLGSGSMPLDTPEKARERKQQLKERAGELQNLLTKDLISKEVIPDITETDFWKWLTGEQEGQTRGQRGQSPFVSGLTGSAALSDIGDAVHAVQQMRRREVKGTSGPSVGRVSPSKVKGRRPNILDMDLSGLEKSVGTKTQRILQEINKLLSESLSGLSKNKIQKAIDLAKELNKLDKGDLESAAPETKDNIRDLIKRRNQIIDKLERELNKRSRLPEGAAFQLASGGVSDFVQRNFGSNTAVGGTTQELVDLYKENLEEVQGMGENIAFLRETEETRERRAGPGALMGSGERRVAEQLVEGSQRIEKLVDALSERLNISSEALKRILKRITGGLRDRAAVSGRRFGPGTGELGTETILPETQKRLTFMQRMENNLLNFFDQSFGNINKELAKQFQSNVENTLSDALFRLFTGGEMEFLKRIGEDFLRMLADNIAQGMTSALPVKQFGRDIGNMLMQVVRASATNIISGMFGTGGGGATVSSAATAVPGATVTKQAGGMVRGPGGIDNVPAQLTNGEFVIRRESVNNQTLPLLRKINRQGFQSGGQVGRSNASSGQGVGLEIRNVNINAVDAKSFERLLSENSEAVTNQIASALDQNKQIRQIIQDKT